MANLCKNRPCTPHLRENKNLTPFYYAKHCIYALFKSLDNPTPCYSKHCKETSPELPATPLVCHSERSEETLHKATRQSQSFCHSEGGQRPTEESLPESLVAKRDSSVVSLPQNDKLIAFTSNSGSNSSLRTRYDKLTTFTRNPKNNSPVIYAPARADNLKETLVIQGGDFLSSRPHSRGDKITTHTGVLNPHHKQNEESQTPSPQAKRLKLLHLASDCVQGGAERVFANTIAQSLPYYDVYVASCDTPKDLPKGIKAFIKLDDWGDYPKYKGALKYIFNLKNYFALKAFLFTHKPDIIHTQNYLSRLSPSVLYALKAYQRKIGNVKLIYTQHGFGSCANGGLYNYAKGKICESCIGSTKFAIAWRNCDRRGRIYSLLKAARSVFYQSFLLNEKTLFSCIICVGQFQYQKHLQDNYPKEKLRILPNPIDLRFFNPHVSVKDKQDVIVFYGRLSPEKNVPLLICAFAKLIALPKFSHYKLLLIGEGDDKLHCMQLAQALLSANQVEFLDYQSPGHLRQILKIAKISALPSLLYETFGLTIVESLLAGAIPLASAHGALQESIERFGGKSFRYYENWDLNVISLQSALLDILEHFESYFYPILSQAKALSMQENAYIQGLIEIYNGGGGIRCLLKFAHFYVLILNIFIQKYIYFRFFYPHCLRQAYAA
ncbi:glycosyltransferase family 4 protein [Helicobacter marmotae]|uniref:glycosyltransferase family 4 protein n=1 Tax=Helicobacter marmotae TaxID=152490 RepID=UPI001473A92B|nr:glycosyltransferase family 4 protein [Helicobacter marmotae]